MKQTVLPMLVIFGCASAGGGATLRVPTDYTTINAGLDAAVAGDTVLVAPGVYPDFEVRNVGGSIFSACAFLRNGVTLKSESGASVTSIDRMAVGGGNFSVLLWGDNLPNGTLVEGFRLTGNPPGGTATAFGNFGAGELVMRGCWFEALENGAQGATIRIVNANARFEDCVFRNCSGRNAAISQDHGSLTLIRTTVEDCASGSSPILGLGHSYPTFRRFMATDCVFRNNTAEGEGGVITTQQYLGGIEITGCTFMDNSAVQNAGAVYLSGAGEADKTIRGNLFLRNTVTGSQSPDGGALVANGGRITIEENTFVASRLIHAGGGSAIQTSGENGSVIRHNVIAGSSGGPAVECGSGITLSCNVFWSNADGDVDGCVLSSTDLIADPQFCDPASDNYYVSQSSPCVPENNPNCGPIGAFGVGCGLISVTPMSWGQIKGMYQLREE